MATWAKDAAATRRAPMPVFRSGQMISCWQRGQGPCVPEAATGTRRVIPQAGQWNWIASGIANVGMPYLPRFGGAVDAGGFVEPPHGQCWISIRSIDAGAATHAMCLAREEWVRGWSRSSRKRESSA